MNGRAFHFSAVRAAVAVLMLIAVAKGETQAAWAFLALERFASALESGPLFRGSEARR